MTEVDVAFVGSVGVHAVPVDLFDWDHGVHFYVFGDDVGEGVGFDFDQFSLTCLFFVVSF